MKELFSMDRKDYNPEGKVTSRPSARGIIAKDGKVLLVHSKKFDYYKFPGGGMEKQLGPNEYLKQHLMIDAAILLLISLYPLITLKKWKQKSENKKIFLFDTLRHLVLPAALLVVLPCMGTPLSVVWLFAKDVAIVLYVSVTVLFLMGVYKCGYLIKRKKG